MARPKLRTVPAHKYSEDVARWTPGQLACRDENSHDFTPNWDVTYVRGGFFYFWDSVCARCSSVVCRKITYVDGKKGKRILSYVDPDYLARHGRPDRAEITQRRQDVMVRNTIDMASEEELLYPNGRPRKGRR